MRLTDQINRSLHELFRGRLFRFYRKEVASIRRNHPEYFQHTSDSFDDLRNKHITLFSRLDSSVDDSWLRYFHHVTGIMDYRFMPSTVYYGIIERCFNNCECASHDIEDKNLMSKYIPLDYRAKCELRYIRGCFFDDEFNPLSQLDAQKVLNSYKEVLIGKVASGSSGGHSVRMIRPGELSTQWIIDNTMTYVVQERIVQEREVAALHPSSVNTCRIMTFRRPWDGETRVIAAMLRLGSGDGVVDNISSGGASVGVRLDGTLVAKGVDCKYGIVTSHRDSGRRFEGFTVPGFDKMCRCVIDIARRVPDFNILGFDVAIRDDGRPCVIEVNATSLCAIEVQMAGPMFGDDTERVVEWCQEHANFDSFHHIRTWY